MLAYNKIFINKILNSFQTINIILHIRNFYITDSASWRKLLELSLELKLVKSIYLLCYMNVITVSDVILVSYPFYYSKTLLETFCKLVGS